VGQPCFVPGLLIQPFAEKPRPHSRLQIVIHVFSRLGGKKTRFSRTGSHAGR
jgi:hypothetical protein